MSSIEQTVITLWITFGRSMISNRVFDMASEMRSSGGNFTDQAAAILHARNLVTELVWHPDLLPGSRLLVVDEAGDTIAEFPLKKPLH